MSCVPPKDYQNRFLEYIKSRLRNNREELENILKTNI